MKKTTLQTLLNYTLFLLGLLFLGSATFAQTGNVKGKVIDSLAQEGVIVTVELKGATSLFTSSDIEGNFNLENVKVGTYTIVFSSVGYNTKNVENVKVAADKTTELNVT